MEIEKKYATIGNYSLLKCLGQGYTAKYYYKFNKLKSKIGLKSN